MVKIPHGNMSPEDLLRMTKKTCPCYIKVFKYNHGILSQKIYIYNHGMVKILHGNMSPEDLLLMPRRPVLVTPKSSNLEEEARGLMYA